MSHVTKLPVLLPVEYTRRSEFLLKSDFLLN